MRLRGLGLGFVLWIGLISWASNVQAQVESVETIGVYRIRDASRTTVIARDAAVENGIWAGVSGVATRLMGRASDAPEDLEVVRKALGADVLPYTRSFRIVEDKGEAPARFSTMPDVSAEYIVVVEAIVDVDRVKSALESKGLLDSGGGLSLERGEPILVELVGVARYPAYEAIREALRAKLGATRVDSLGFARDRQLLSVEGPFGPAGVYASLSNLEMDGIRLRPVGVDEAGRRVRFEGIEVP